MNMNYIFSFSKKLAYFTSMAVAASLLLACASKVPLNDSVKVEDRTGQLISPIDTEQPNADAVTVNSGGPLTTREVKPLDLSTAQQNASGRILYFDFDSYTVKPQFQGLIEAEAKRLNADRSSKIALAGHTDEVGGREYNIALGQKRAEAVKRALVLLGVQESQLEAVSYGKEKPAATGTEEAVASQNRRVELSSR